MNDLPRQKLVEIIAEYGSAIIDEPRRVEGLLKDLCGDCKREINTLMDAARERVPQDLRDANPNLPPEILVNGLVQRLLGNRAMSEEIARWAVESWAAALGVPVQPALNAAAEEETRRAAEAYAAEQARLEAQRRAAEAQAAEQARWEEERRAAEAYAAEQARLEERRRSEAYAAEQARREEERRAAEAYAAEQARREEQRRAAEALVAVQARLENHTPPNQPAARKKISRRQFLWISGGVIGVGLCSLAAYATTDSLFAAPAVPTPAPTVARTAAPAAAKKNYKDMTLCYPQLGAESDWRTANTASFKETADKLGIKKLVFSDAQQKQENQIAAMRACIQQGVDVIALPPVVEDGWDAVLTEAKNAKIPVIIVDRSVKANSSLYASHIGSNMELEGKKAGDEMNKALPNGGKIIELSGTTGSGAAVGRAKGFRTSLAKNIAIIDSQTGNFTRAEGKTVFEALLKKYGKDITGVFIHNDDMAIGAIEAMKAAGLKPGDIKIISVDGTRGGFQAMIDGWIQADVECNPLLGPQVYEMALKLMNGETIEREVLTNETVFYPSKAAELLPTRKY